MLIQAAASGLGMLVSSKKSGLHALPVQHFGHQRGYAHMAGIKGQVDSAFTSIFRLCAYWQSASSYYIYSKMNIDPA